MAPPKSESVPVETSRSPVEREVHRIQEMLQAREFAEALRAADVLGTQVPENRDVVYLTAIAQRFLGRTSDSLNTLSRLESLQPSFSRLYQERGHCFVAQRDAPHAIEAFLKAVNINPALPASWSMLEGLYRMTGQTENSATAAAHVAKLRQLPPAVVEATSLLSDGDLAHAEAVIRPYLLTQPTDIEGMRLLGRIALARDVLDDAELLLKTVLELAPDYQAARYDYSRALLERHKHREAREQLELLLKRDPQNRSYLINYGTTLVGLGEHEAAIGIYSKLLTNSPRAFDLHLSLGHCYKTLGRQSEAIESYRASADARHDYGDAYWSLANLKTYRFTDDEIARMREHQAAPTTSLVDRYHLSFALGKAYEDRGEYEQSWRFYAQGNAFKRSESHYRPEQIERNTRLQIEIVTADFLNSRAGMGCESPDPIFIVGLPRAGSTLIEQILASHSQVEGTQELADIPRMVLELQGRDPDLDNPRYPASIANLTAAELRQLGERYIRDTQVYRMAGGADATAASRNGTNKSGAAGPNATRPYFIDKMPNNFRHLGLIHLILPNARIIDARREPMACCFSNLKQLFASGQEFTYSIEDIARYYRTYLQLMEHWNAVMPGRVLRVHHEDVVDDLESSVRRILQFCGLPFEPACMEFHQTQRSVRTASSEQVRRPIFREGLDQWKNYEQWLGPLREALGDALTGYRAETNRPRLS